MRIMKDSRVEWIKEMPTNWDLKKLKYLTTKCERGTAPDYIDDNITAVVNQATFSKGYFDTSNIRFSSKPAETSRGLLKKQDILLASTGGGVLGKTFYFNEDETYVADGHVTIIRTNSSLISKFLYYYFYINFETFNSQMAEGSTNQTELQRDLLCEMPVPLPPLPEQRLIASFLDVKCAEIDALTSDIQQQIDTLEQYKRSVITETVTKGLNPDAKMKDSGIEWVGEIPENWEIMPNKYIMHKEKIICPIYQNEDILSLTMNGVIVRDLDAGGKMPKTFDGYQKIRKGNLLMCLFDIDVTPRCIGIINSNGLTSPAYSQFILHNNATANYYYYYYLMLDFTKELLHMAKNLRHSLTEEQLGAIQVPVPPVGEQKAIADYLDAKCAEIDGIISQKREQISTIEEYKKSLIFEYVTGKKEVPNNE